MHIIVGLDESASAQAALGWALRMAARCGATVEAARSWAYGSVPMQQLLPPEEMDRLAEEGLRASLAGLDAASVPVRATVLRGPAHHALLGLIEHRHPSLVVVGRRGGDERAAPRLLGSVSRRLVEAAPCPVVVVSDDPAAAADPPPVVLVAVDGSEHAARALRWSVDFAKQVGASIVLATVIGLADSAAGATKLSDDAHDMVERAAATVGSAGVAVSTVVGVGDPRHELERIADDHAVDLVVVGTRGLGPIAKLITGTVAAHLSEYADRPVAVIPPPAQ